MLYFRRDAVGTREVRSADGTWKVKLSAFRSSYVVYKEIGATITSYHWQEGGWWIFKKYKWVKRPIDELYLTVSYVGVLPTLEPGIANDRKSERNRSSVTIKLKALFLSSTVYDYYGNVQSDILDVRGVRASGGALIGMERISLPETTAGRA
jgi:hypothetical protein